MFIGIIQNAQGILDDVIHIDTFFKSLCLAGQIQDTFYNILCLIQFLQGIGEVLQDFMIDFTLIQLLVNQFNIRLYET